MTKALNQRLAYYWGKASSDVAGTETVAEYPLSKVGMTEILDDELAAAKQILKAHPGQWEIKYNEKNLAGKRLWHTMTALFQSEACHLNDEDTVLGVNLLI
jgi:hypothetical protein